MQKWDEGETGNRSTATKRPRQTVFYRDLVECVKYKNVTEAFKTPSSLPENWQPCYSHGFPLL